MRFIGLTRFSVVSEASLGSFKMTRDGGYETAVSDILSDDRLSRRFPLFEAFTLPSIRALMAREPDYWHLIAISDRLPRSLATRLRGLLTGLPRVRVLQIGRRDDMHAAFRAAASEISGASAAFTFRLDDDDALASNYLDLVRAAVKGCTHDVAVSVDDGFSLETAGARYHLERTRAPLIAIGLGLMSNQPKTIFDLGGHKTVGRHARVIHVRDSLGWVNVRHGYSDSRKGSRKWCRRFRRRLFARLTTRDVMEQLGPNFAHIHLVKKYHPLSSHGLPAQQS